MSLPRRLSVVVPGFLIGIGISIFLVLGTVPWNLDTLKSAFLPVAGPFVACLLLENDVLVIMLYGIPLAILIGLHPLRPSRGTAAASGPAIFLWFLFGIILTYLRF